MEETGRGIKEGEGRLYCYRGDKDRVGGGTCAWIADQHEGNCKERYEEPNRKYAFPCQAIIRKGRISWAYLEKGAGSCHILEN